MNPALIDPMNGSRELREGLFDVVSYAAQAVIPATITFFGHTQDVSGPQVTNLTKANELPAGESMRVYSLRIGFTGGTGLDATDLAAIRKKFRVRLFVAEKPVLTGLTQQFPFGGGMLSDEGSEVGAIPFWITDDDLAIQIKEGVRFRVELQSSASYTLTHASKTVDIIVMLDGIHAVPVN